MPIRKGGNVLRFSSLRAAQQADWRNRVVSRLPIVGTANDMEKPNRPHKANGDFAPTKAPKDSYGLAAAFRQAGLPVLESEFRFATANGRNWRFDYAAPQHKIAIEIEGGIFDGADTGHRSISGILRDIAKYNAATLLGWRVLRYIPRDIGESLADVRALLAEDSTCP